MLNKINELNIMIAQAKLEFEHYIVHSDIPLNVRWEAFIAAPECLKNHARYIVHFASLPEQTLGYDCTVHCKRYETVNVDNLIECLEERFGENEDAAEKGVEPYYNMEGIDLVKLKEEILQKNLGSFVYDW